MGAQAFQKTLVTISRFWKEVGKMKKGRRMDKEKVTKMKLCSWLNNYHNLKYILIPTFHYFSSSSTFSFLIVVCAGLDSLSLYWDTQIVSRCQILSPPRTDTRSLLPHIFISVFIKKCNNIKTSSKTQYQPRATGEFIHRWKLLADCNTADPNLDPKTDME